MFQFLSTLNLAPLELLLNHSRVCEDEAVQCQTCTARTQIALASAYSDMLEASWNGTWSSYSSCSMFLWGTLSVISLFRLPTSIPLQSSCLRSPHRRVMQLAASVGPMMHPQTQASFHSVLNVGWWWGTKSELIICFWWDWQKSRGKALSRFVVMFLFCIMDIHAKNCYFSTSNMWRTIAKVPVSLQHVSFLTNMSHLGVNLIILLHPIQHLKSETWTYISTGRLRFRSWTWPSCPWPKGESTGGMIRATTQKKMGFRIGECSLNSNDISSWR